MKEILQKLISFPSVPTDQATNMLILDYVEEFLHKRGMTVVRHKFEDHGALWATTRGVENSRSPKILLGAHVDIIPAEPEMFTLRQEGDKLIGRGVYDMKFALATYMDFVDKNQDKLQNYDFGIMVTTDEEMGGVTGVNGVRELLNLGYRTEVCVLPDGGENWQLEIFAKGFAHYVLEAKGKTAHGSRPWEGTNALLKLIEALHVIKTTLFADHGPMTSTINVGMVHGGDAVNKIPDYARADIETRFINHDDFERIPQEIQKICDKYGIELQILAHFDSIRNSLNNPYIAEFTNSIEKVTKIKNTGVMSYGGSDARFFVMEGIPSILVHPEGGGQHAADEWISEKGMYQFGEVLEDFLNKTAK